MTVNESFRSFVLDQLSRVAPNIRSRSMFGGVGIYSADYFFALIDGDTIYLKVDDSNRGDFEARGLGPFRPFGEGGETMQYYHLDEGILEDVNELRPWVEKAIAVARAKRVAKRKPKPAKRPAKKAAAKKSSARKSSAKKKVVRKRRT
jgi:DNA transformation protein